MSKIKDLLCRAMRAQKEYLVRYRAGHTTLGCRVTHMIGVPMIMASILAFILYLLPALQVTAIILHAALSPLGIQSFSYYLLVTLPNILQSALTMPSALVNLYASIALFAIGWIFQFIGHVVYQKNSPLFLSNPFNLLSYTTAVIFIAEEYGQLIAFPFRRK